MSRGKGSGPRKGQGWDSVQDILNGVRENYQTHDLTQVYDSISSVSMLLNRLEGLVPGEQDYHRQLLEMENPKCEVCRDINYMAATGNTDLESRDPTLKTTYWVEEEESRKKDCESRYTGFFEAYCPDHKEDTFFEYTESWHE